MLIALAYLFAAASIAAVMLKLNWSRLAWSRSRPPAAARYVPWEVAKDAKNDSVLVVDCTHTGFPTMTHHKGHRNPPGGCSDCSTGLVLDALAATGSLGAMVAPWLVKPAVSVNHFDADAVLSLWAYCHQDTALEHSALLRHAARIGDLREAGLGSSPEALAARSWDGVTSEEQVHHALKLCCWINTIERTRFSPPYVDKDADAKHVYFLERLAAALTTEGIAELRQEWEEDYSSVLAGWQLMEDMRPNSVHRHDNLGMVVLRPARPLNYYSLFSFAIGADTVVTVLPGNRYEVESRYTQFVSLFSRPVQARLDLGPLAKALNRVDTGREEGVQWASNSLVDTGPLLRLERDGDKLSKAQRYGQPNERLHYRSGLPPAIFEAVVCSYHHHGLRGTQPKVGGWSWELLQQHNASIDWAAWERDVLSGVLAG